jgi:uncharacterized protein (DUF2336 family)
MAGFLKSLFKGKGGGEPDPIDYERSKQMLEAGADSEREAVAAHPDVRPEILYYLTEDPSPRVRQALARNAATPRQADLILSTDADEDVRVSLVEKVALLAPDLDEDARDKVSEATRRSLVNLARDEAVRVRQVMAETLAHVAGAPPDIIRTLARDVEIVVAGPVLEHSPVLTSEDLLDIIRSNPIAGALDRISQRRSVDAEVSDAIIAADDEGAIALLLQNDGAQIREESLDAVIARAPDVERWHVPLACRPALPPSAGKRMARFVAEHVIDMMIERQDFSAETLEEVRAVVQRRLDDGDFPDSAQTQTAASPDEVRRQVLELAEQSKLTDSAIADAIDAGNRAFVVAALAQRAGLNESVVATAFNAPSAKGLCALAWKAKASAGFAERLQIKIGRIAPRAVVKATPDGDYDMSADEAQWQIDFLTDLAKRK